MIQIMGVNPDGWRDMTLEERVHMALYLSTGLPGILFRVSDGDEYYYIRAGRLLNGADEKEECK